MGDYIAEEFIEIPNGNSGPLKINKVAMKPRKQSSSKLAVNNTNISSGDIDQQLSEYIVRGENGVYSCGYCGKAGKHLYNMRKHVETHMEGLSFPCQSCDKTFRSRNSLSIHNTRYHRS